MTGPRESGMGWEEIQAIQQSPAAWAAAPLIPAGLA